MTDPTIDKAALEACPWCGLTEHLSVRAEGSYTPDMPARPYRVVCNHIDHDTVEGPIGYGRNGAIAAWNRRAPTTDAVGVTVREWTQLIADLDAAMRGQPDVTDQWWLDCGTIRAKLTRITASLNISEAEPVAWPEPVITNPDIGPSTGIPYIDSLLHRLMDAQQDINEYANETMSQRLADASSLCDEIETVLRKLGDLGLEP